MFKLRIKAFTVTLLKVTFLHGVLVVFFGGVKRGPAERKFETPLLFLPIQLLTTQSSRWNERSASL